MKYKCFCHYEDYREMTKEEAGAMLRGKQPIEFNKFVRYYKIQIEDIYRFMRNKGMNLRSVERETIRNLSDQEKISTGQIHEVYSFIDEVPLSILAKHYGVEKTYVKGQACYDAEEVKWAKNQFNKDRESGIPQETYSELKPIDLMAMRYYRGVSKKRMSRASGLSIPEISSLEQRGRVREKHAKVYKEVLKISQRHIVQLKKIMQGKLKNVTDNRYIPKSVKVGVWSRDKGLCSNCKQKDDLHYHHKIRFSEGGQNTMRNLILLCASCHAEEHKGEKGYHMLKKMAEK